MPYERKTADIFISEELKNILLEIESESTVAQLLLKKRHSKSVLVDNAINYISISTQDRGRLSYLTVDRIESITDGDYWKTSKRYVAKPGTLVSKLFKDISSKEVEKFSLLFRSEAQKPYFRFEVVSGEEIKKIYHYSSVASDGSGSLGVSCMKHDNCQKYLDIYSTNEEVSMLVMFNEDNYVIGRALLWDFDSHKLMDRIYTANDEVYSMYFKKWCVKNGYLHKSDQNWYNTLQFEQFGQKRIELKLKLTLKNNNFEYYPYMDTFKIIDKDGNLYNYQPTDVEFNTICSTDGRKQSHDFIRFDSISNVFRYPGDTVWLTYRGVYTHHQNCHYSESMDMYILKDDSQYNEEARDYIFNELNDSLNDRERIDRRKSYYSERESTKKKSIFAEYLDTHRQFHNIDFGNHDVIDTLMMDVEDTQEQVENPTVVIGEPFRGNMIANEGDNNTSDDPTTNLYDTELESEVVSFADGLELTRPTRINRIDWELVRMDFTDRQDPGNDTTDTTDITESDTLAF